MGFTPRPASGHSRPHDATIMYHQNIQCKSRGNGNRRGRDVRNENSDKKLSRISPRLTPILNANH